MRAHLASADAAAGADDGAEGADHGAEGAEGTEVGDAAVMRVAAAGARVAAAAAIGDSDVASKSARYILDAFSDHSPLGGEWDGGFGDVPPGLERASSVSLSRSEALIELALRAANEPHGFAVAHAFKQCAQWIALAAAGDDDVNAVLEGDARGSGRATLARADAMYALAEEMSASARSSAATAAAASGMYADVAFADVKLGRAQLALRLATSLAARLNRKDESEVARSSEGGGAADGLDPGGDSPGGESPGEESESVEETRGYDELRDALADAESSAAAALTACEALGGSGSHTSEDAPNESAFFPDARVALAVAASGDVYVARAVVAAKGRGGVGDGAGVMFAEGLYRNALRLMGTPRPPTSTADDADAAAGGAAPAHLRLCAAMVHARYAAILRASGGGRREREAGEWAAAAAREWRAPGYGDKDDACAVAWAARSIGSVGEGGEKACVHDLTLMMPVTLHCTRYPPRC